ncbi:Cu(I)/Ag(I) efflux system membrane fusion protein [Arcticibacter tournemirensis]|uniref:Efflux RND transporter periplasmic adaptor subunit n=1 Tax=Arcticibacter tournemirensis TaxID=699437 RepID=A0A5M9GNE6_9SPHI|nr:efflux RND transporter periplasmic adaptor subunit [Arcticibacter tournemirensis]KAA8476253.1 efflux RND transporter periplasmic adaptor subunit [Arcticibacter tournemirensis]TQM49539.1 Cu(I)/Ag(I) efflux system membrane fusion protein [Arcticibacter tournemirensis]
MKKKKIIGIIVSMLLFSVAVWIYFKPTITNNSNVTHEGMSDMKTTSSRGHEIHSHQTSEKAEYTCAMHPQIIRSEPGNCPICGMSFVKKAGLSNEIHNISLHTVLQSTNRFAISSIPSVTLTKREVPVEINALGYTAYNTTQVGAISARITGRIEKLYVRYRFQPVKKGQKIMDIYSPELLTAQQNLLFLLKSDPLNTSLIDASREKLLLLGFTNQQLKEVESRRKPLYRVAIYSQYSGHIHEASRKEMGGNTPQPVSMSDNSSLITKELNLKEGMYLQKGQTIFDVYNPNRIWALLNIYPAEQSHIKVGNKVRIVSETGSGQEVDGLIYFIEPFFREGSKSLIARVNINNNELQSTIGGQVRATISGGRVDAQWLPKESVLSLGLQSIVFLKNANGFRAQKVSTGIEYKNLIQITAGIRPSDSVAANAQFLMDSESFIKTDK